MKDDFSLGIDGLEVLCGGKIDKSTINFFIAPSEVPIRDFIYKIALKNIENKGLIFADATNTPEIIQNDIKKRGYNYNPESDNINWLDYYSWNVKSDLSHLDTEKNIYRCANGISSFFLGLITSINNMSKFDLVDAIFLVFPSILLDLSNDEIFHKMNELFAKLKDSKIRSFFVVTEDLWPRLKLIGIDSLVDFQIKLKKDDNLQQIKVEKSPYLNFNSSWFDFSLTGSGPKINVSGEIKNIEILINFLLEIHLQNIDVISEDTFFNSMDNLSSRYPFIKKIDLKADTKENINAINTSIGPDELVEILTKFIKSLIKNTNKDKSIKKNVTEILNTQIQLLDDEKLKSKLVELLFKLESGALLVG